MKDYIKQVVKNCKALGGSLKEEGFRLVSGGSDNHLLLVDTKVLGITGKEAEEILGKVNITCNKNSIPFDPEKPAITSGIRLGTPAMTTKGFNEEDFIKVGKLIASALKDQSETNLVQIKKEVVKLATSHPNIR